MNRVRSWWVTARALTAFLALGGLLPATTLRRERDLKPDIPRTWDDAALAEWATPLATLNVRPATISAKESYALPTENLRTYPAYFPGREPAGYWEMLQHVGPKPLIDPRKLKSEGDWVEAGRQVFDELDESPPAHVQSKVHRGGTEPRDPGTGRASGRYPTERSSGCAGCRRRAASR